MENDENPKEIDVINDEIAEVYKNLTCPVKWLINEL